MTGCEQTLNQLRCRPARRAKRPAVIAILGCAIGLLSAQVRADAEGPLLADALAAIAANGVRLIYSSETVPPDARAAGPPRGTSTAERLHSLLAPLNLEARQLPSGGYVIVAVSRRAAATLTLAVTVDGESPPEAVAAALVLVPQARRRTRTDRLGRATLVDLAPGSYDVEVRAEGFRAARREVAVEPSGLTTLAVALVREPTSVAQVIVETSRYDSTASVGVPISRDALQASPVTSNDTARALQVLPGTAVAGYTARTHIRGSRDDETLFRYDGLTLTDPYHLNDLQSLLSAIDPATVESVTSWTGVAPIEFGGRIGGVVDIEPRRMSAPAIDAQTSQRDASLLLGSPFADARGTVFAALRIGNALSPVGWIDQETGPPAFDDLVIRATWAIDAQTSLAAGILAIDDRRAAFSIGRSENARVSGQDLYSWVRLAHEFAPMLRSETLVSTEDSRDHIAGSANQPAMENGTLSRQDNHFSYTVREELKLSTSARWSTLLGAEHTATSVNNQLATVATFAPPFVPALQPSRERGVATNTSVNASNSAVYGAVRWQASDWTIADLGVRRDSRRFGAVPGDAQASARASLRQRLSDSTTLRLGWGQGSQADLYNLTRAADGTLQPAAPRRVTQSNLSLERWLGNGLSLRAEAYLKREQAPLQTYENVFSEFALVPELEVDYQAVLSQGARMRGVEFSVESDQSRPVSGWLTYAWSRAEDRIGGRWTPRSWDQPHAVQLGTRWQRGPWRAAGVLSWHSGWPYTPLRASSTQWVDPSTVTLVLAPRNSARLGNVLSLDLRVGWEHALWSGTLEAFLELYDATDSQAVCCRNYSVVSQPDGSSRLVEAPGVWLAFTPILGVRWRN